MCEMKNKYDFLHISENFMDKNQLRQKLIDVADKQYRQLVGSIQSDHGFDDITRHIQDCIDTCKNIITVNKYTTYEMISNTISGVVGKNYELFFDYNLCFREIELIVYEELTKLECVTAKRAD